MTDEMEEAAFIGVARHRLRTDGEGVTTLAAFHGCTLRCRYCLNPQCLRFAQSLPAFTPQTLYEMVRVDNLYFLATGGGVTFGGGEPALHPAFITRFRELCGPEWGLTLESALNVPTENVRQLAPVINHFIIDIKDTCDEIYQRYTGRSNRQALDNLQWLLQEDRANDILVRLPLIPEFNTPADVDRSQEYLQSLGVRHFDRFTYRTDIQK